MVRRSRLGGRRARTRDEMLSAVDPVSPEFAFHYNRGLSLEQHGHADQAAEAYREAIRVDPFDIDAQVHLGLLLRELGRDDEANRAFLMALDLRRQAMAPPKRRRGSLPLDFTS